MVINARQGAPLLSKVAAGLLALFVFLISMVILVGWHFNITFLTHLYPEWPPTKPLALIGFILASIALWQIPHPPRLMRTVILRSNALLGILLCSAVFVLYFAFGINYNQIIFPQFSDMGALSLPSVANFFILAIAFFCTTGGRFFQYCAQYLFALALIIPLFILIGYFYTIPVFYSVNSLGGISFVSACLFAICSFTGFFSNPHLGIASIFHGNQPGNIFARYAIPSIIIFPILFGYFFISLERAEFVTSRLNEAFMIFQMVILSVPIFWAIAFWINAKNSELHVAKDKAEEATRTKSAFLANMSHELRTPLNTIMGYTELVQETMEQEGKKDYSKQLGLVLTSSKHLLDLINDILDMSKIEAGKMDITLEFVKLEELMELIESDMAPLIKDRHNTFSITLLTHKQEMYSDMKKIRQILLNLLMNANKFTENGHISLEIESVVENNEPRMKFTVRDTGVGIAPDVLSRLFQGFSQGDYSPTRKYGGTGLGLYLVKRFCELLDGHISVQSTQGKGAVFTLLLPVRSKVPLR